MSMSVLLSLIFSGPQWFGTFSGEEEKSSSIDKAPESLLTKFRAFETRQFNPEADLHTTRQVISC